MHCSHASRYWVSCNNASSKRLSTALFDKDCWSSIGYHIQCCSCRCNSVEVILAGWRALGWKPFKALLVTEWFVLSFLLTDHPILTSTFLLYCEVSTSALVVVWSYFSAKPLGVYKDRVPVHCASLTQPILIIGIRCASAHNQQVVVIIVQFSEPVFPISLLCFILRTDEYQDDTLIILRFNMPWTIGIIDFTYHFLTTLLNFFSIY